MTTFVRCPVHMRPAAGRITDFLGIGLLHRDGTLKRRVKGGHGIDVAGGSLVPQFLSRANCGRERVQQDTCTDGGGTQMFGSLPRSSRRPFGSGGLVGKCIGEAAPSSGLSLRLPCRGLCTVVFLHVKIGYLGRAG